MRRQHVKLEMETAKAYVLAAAAAETMGTVSTKSAFATVDTVAASVALQMIVPESLLRATVASATVHRLDHSVTVHRVLSRAIWVTQYPGAPRSQFAMPVS